MKLKTKLKKLVIVGVVWEWLFGGQTTQSAWLCYLEVVVQECIPKSLPWPWGGSATPLTNLWWLNHSKALRGGLATPKAMG
jgi:hypothetical protein